MSEPIVWQKPQPSFNNLRPAETERVPYRRFNGVFSSVVLNYLRGRDFYMQVIGYAKKGDVERFKIRLAWLTPDICWIGGMVFGIHYHAEPLDEMSLCHKLEHFLVALKARVMVAEILTPDDKAFILQYGRGGCHSLGYGGNYEFTLYDKLETTALKRFPQRLIDLGVYEISPMYPHERHDPPINWVAPLTGLGFAIFDVLEPPDTFASHYPKLTLNDF